MNKLRRWITPSQEKSTKKRTGDVSFEISPHHFRSSKIWLGYQITFGVLLLAEEQRQKRYTWRFSELGYRSAASFDPVL